MPCCYDARRVNHDDVYYGPGRLGAFLRLVLKTFAVGTFFGVHVRMYWIAALLMPLIFLQRLAPFAANGLEALAWITIWFVGLFVVIWTHEMGHIAAGWRWRTRTDLITLSPLGGVAHMGARPASPREEIGVSLAGPAVHLVWLAVFWPLQLLLPDRVLAIDGWNGCPLVIAVDFLVGLNTGLMLFNLLPLYPLDGGRVLRGLLSLRWHGNLATLWVTTLGMIGGGVFVLLGVLRPDLWGTIFVVMGLANISASLQERRVAQHVLIYQPRVRHLWEPDPDAWKRGGTTTKGPPGPGWFTRWRRARAERQAANAAAADAALDREVDAVLERVHQVGMAGLDDRERAILKKASQRRRGAG